MKNSKITRMAGIALLMAMVVVMQFITASIPPVSGFSISLVLIPIVLGAAIFGAKAGALLGATFGVVVVINCITGADAGGHMVFQANPILCIAVVLGKGILAGLVSGMVYSAFAKANGYLAMVLAAIVCPVVNTGIFLLGCLIFFLDSVKEMAAGEGMGIWMYLIVFFVGLNFIFEFCILRVDIFLTFF